MPTICLNGEQIQRWALWITDQPAAVRTEVSQEEISRYEAHAKDCSSQECSWRLRELLAPSRSDTEVIEGLDPTDTLQVRSEDYVPSESGMHQALEMASASAADPRVTEALREARERMGSRQAPSYEDVSIFEAWKLLLLSSNEPPTQGTEDGY